MQAGKLISSRIPALKTSDTVQMTHDRMLEFKVSHLPIVNEIQFLGLVSDDDLLEVENQEISLGTISLSLLNCFVYEHTHIFDAMKLMNHKKLSVVPVLNHRNDYKGMITIQKLIDFLSNSMSIDQNGAIFVISMSKIDHSLAQMAQIVESNAAKILASYTSTFTDTTKIEITLKINQTDIRAIKADFERYNYEIVAIFNHLDDDNGLKDRYDALMNYLKT